MAGFNDAFDGGVRMSQGWKAQAAQKRELDMRQLEQAAEQKRRDQLGQQFEMDMALKKEEAARYVEAETAFQKFGESTQAIDWSSPTARKEYEQAVRLHLPSVLKHENTAKKWEAINKANMQSQTYTDAKTLEVQMSEFMGDALRNGMGPQALAIQSEVKSGKLSAMDAMTKLGNLMKKRDDELYKRQIELRKISNPEHPPAAPNFKNATTPGDQYELKDIDRQIEADQAIYEKLVPGGILPTDPAKKAALMPVMARLKSNRDRRRAISANIEARASSSRPASSGTGAANRYKIELVEP